ncbi:MAG: ABC transporter substrate-binding protein [Desulfobacterales bacterium]|nr:ABC transporter substrate-binding protein [Desulfobacterales bacterium]
MKKICLLIFLLAFFAQPVLSSDVQEVGQLIRENVDKVLKIVRTSDLGKEDKKKQVMDVVNRIFNLPLMAKLTLGQTHWTNLNEQQRAEFTDLFIKQMQGIYLNQLELAVDATVSFEEPVQEEKKVYMLTRAATKDEPIKILYKLYKSSDKWRVYDVEIQDVSIVKSYGLQYNQILKEGSSADLIRKLKEKIVQNESESSK